MDNRPNTKPQQKSPYPSASRGPLGSPNSSYLKSAPVKGRGKDKQFSFVWLIVISIIIAAGFFWVLSESGLIES